VSARHGTAGTVRVMNDEHGIDFSDCIGDLEVFGRTYGLLVNLSRYLDNVAGGVVAGTVDGASVQPFADQAVVIYTDLRRVLLDQITDDSLAAAAGEMLRPLSSGVGVLEAALVADQSQAWVDATIRPGVFARRIKLAAMQLGLEEVATSAQLGEQSAKAAAVNRQLQEIGDLGMSRANAAGASTYL
jgi:hypothetical protein